jgi:hypothetical protein
MRIPVYPNKAKYFFQFFAEHVSVSLGFGCGKPINLLSLDPYRRRAYNTVLFVGTSWYLVGSIP